MFCPPNHTNVHVQTIEVDASMIDTNGHVNNIEYLKWMQMIAIAHSSTWKMDDLMKSQSGTWFARKHVIEYLSPVFLGDSIEAKTWIANVGRAKSTRRYVFCRDGQVMARGETDWVYVNITTGRPMRIPEVMKSFVCEE